MHTPNPTSETMTQKLEATAELKHASADKFYGFFKNNMNDLINVFPASFKIVQLLEGEEGSVGCVKLWNYVIGKNILSKIV